MKQGAISFDKVEVKFHLDKDNNPEGVYFKESKDANKLIEEFMLLANRSVAEFIGKQSIKKHLFIEFMMNLMMRKLRLYKILLDNLDIK